MRHAKIILRGSLLCPLIFLLLKPAHPVAGQNFEKVGQFYTVRVPEHLSEAVTVSLRPRQTRKPAIAIFRISAHPSFSEFRLDFGRFIRKLQAYADDGQPLPVRREETNMWKIFDAERLHHMTYEVALREAERAIADQVAAPRRRAQYLSATGAGIFGWLQGCESGHQRIVFTVPPRWKLYSSLEVYNDSIYVADQYEDLQNAVFVMGANVLQDTSTFYGGKLTSLVYSEDDTLGARLLPIPAQAARIAASQADGVPFANHTVLFEIIAPVSRGVKKHFGFRLQNRRLQHLVLPINSIQLETIAETVLRNYLRAGFADDASTSPAADAAQPCSEPLQQFLQEGIPAYLAARVLSQTGNRSEAMLYREIGSWLNAGAARDGADESHPAPESDGSDSLGRQHGRFAFLALMLDLEILHQTRGRKRLDDVLRQILKLRRAGVRVSDLNTWVKICRETTNADVGAFFESYFVSQKPIPFVRTLAFLALEPAAGAQGHAGLRDISARGPAFLEPLLLRKWWLQRIE